MIKPHRCSLKCAGALLLTKGMTIFSCPPSKQMGLWILRGTDYLDLKETLVNKKVLQHSLMELQAERRGRMWLSYAYFELYNPLGSANREESGQSSLSCTPFRKRNAKAAQHISHGKALVVVTQLRTEMLFAVLSYLIYINLMVSAGVNVLLQLLRLQ